MTTYTEFDGATTATEVARAFSSQVNGRHIVITGVSPQGLGEATALALAAHHPALLILVSRTQSKLDAVAEKIRITCPTSRVKLVILDLASNAGVRKAAAEIKAIVPRIDILINNAGLTVHRRQLSADGIEMQLAANHVGHFLLTNLLMEKLLPSAGSNGHTARVVNLSSEAHRLLPIRFIDYNFEIPEGDPLPAAEEGPPLPDELAQQIVGKVVDGYCPMRAYAQSKTANILFTVELNKRFRAKGLVAYSLHPGAVATQVSRDLGSDAEEISRDLFKAMKMTVKNYDQGSATTLVAALDPVLKDPQSGIYLNDCQLTEAAYWAKDEAAAEKLWKLSETLVGQELS